MIVSLRNWTTLTAPMRALRSESKVEAPRKSEKSVKREAGLFESWENMLATQARLVVGSYEQD